MIGALAARNNLRVKNARQPVKRKDVSGSWTFLKQFDSLQHKVL